MRKNRLFELSQPGNDSHDERVSLPGSALLDNEEFKSIYKKEIDALVEKEVALQKKMMAEKLSMEFDKKQKEILSKIEAEAEKQVRLNTQIEEFILQLSGEANNRLESEIVGSKNIIVSLVMEALYKISSSELITKSIIEDVIELSIEKMSIDSAIKLKVSALDYRLLKDMECYDKIKSVVHLDLSLTQGQMCLEDDFSLYKLGIVDRLEALQQAFVKALETKNEL